MSCTTPVIKLSEFASILFTDRQDFDNNLLVFSERPFDEQCLLITAMHSDEVTPGGDACDILPLLRVKSVRLHGSLTGFAISSLVAVDNNVVFATDMQSECLCNDISACD